MNAIARVAGAMLAVTVLATACSGSTFDPARAKSDLQQRAEKFKMGRFDVTYRLHATSDRPETDLTVRWMLDGLDHTKAEFTRGRLVGRDLRAPLMVILGPTGGPIACSSDPNAFGGVSGSADGVCVRGSKASSAADVIDLILAATIVPVAGPDLQGLEVSARSTTSVAGKRSECFSTNAPAGQWCFGDDGTLLRASTTDDQGHVLELEAQDLGSTPTDADFTPPYPIVAQ